MGGGNSTLKNKTAESRPKSNLINDPGTRKSIVDTINKTVKSLNKTITTINAVKEEKAAIHKAAQDEADKERKRTAYQYPPPNKPAEKEAPRTWRETFGLTWTMLVIAGGLGVGGYIFYNYFYKAGKVPVPAITNV